MKCSACSLRSFTVRLKNKHKKSVGLAMNSAVYVRNIYDFMRTPMLAFLLAVLFLVTGCSDKGYSPRAELAPPPPQTGPVASAHDYAALQSINEIQPAAGEEVASFSPTRQVCAVRTGFSGRGSRLGFGHEALPRQDDELSFSRVFSNTGTPMMIRLSVPLRSLVKEHSCR